MPVVENDVLLDQAQPAVILTGCRTGGTFLAHCLSNHPDVYCFRGEPLHRRSIWRVGMPGLSQPFLLHCLLHQPHYKVSGCKVTWAQARNQGVWPYLTDLQPKVIWLHRENILRQAVSIARNTASRAGLICLPQHTQARPGLLAAPIDVEQMKKIVEDLRKERELAVRHIAQMETVLPVTYEEVVGGEGQHASLLQCSEKMCEFLGVRAMPLSCQLAPVGGYRLQDMIENWGEVVAGFRGDNEIVEWVEREC